MMQCVSTMLILLCGLLISSHAKENQCPGDKASCPDDSTCCVLSNGEFGCCPIQVCCGDSAHCCPDGYTCDFIKGICKTGRELMPLLFKFKYKLNMVSVPVTKKRADGATSPDGKSQCPEESTCFKHPSGIYGYCPLKNAVCCSDNRHCCPQGYTCDVEAGKCIKTAEQINMIENIQAIKTSTAGERIKGFQTKEVSQKISARKVKCPDGTYCEYGESCCPVPRLGYLPQGRYRCCPVPFLPDCCRDGRHCCPPPRLCSLDSLSCIGPKLIKGDGYETRQSSLL